MASDDDTRPPREPDAWERHALFTEGLITFLGGLAAIFRGLAEMRRSRAERQKA